MPSAIIQNDWDHAPPDSICLSTFQWWLLFMASWARLTPALSPV
jgi:hypothetical protein